jgi:hypothetical protein
MPDMARSDSARRTGPALEAMYRFLLWLVPTVEKFPRSQKFLLGDRIQTTALDILERLIEATYTRARQPMLAAANLGIEKLRFLFRLSHDLTATWVVVVFSVAIQGTTVDLGAGFLFRAVAEARTEPA